MQKTKLLSLSLVAFLFVPIFCFAQQTPEERAAALQEKMQKTLEASGIDISAPQNGNSLSETAAVEEVNLEESGQTIKINPDSCYFSIQGESEKYPYKRGIDVEKNEKLSLSCGLANSSKEAIDAFPNYKTYLQSIEGEPVDSQKSDSPMKLKANEKKTATFSLPENPQKSQVYWIEISLVDASGKDLSNKIYAPFLVRGNSATIEEINLGQSSYQKEEKAKVSIVWSDLAAAFQSIRPDKYNKEVSPEMYIAEIEIKDSKGEKCGFASGDLSRNGELKNDFEVAIIQKCQNVAATVSIKDKQGNILDQKTYASESNPQAAKGVVSWRGLVFGIVGIVTLLMLIIIFAYIFKKKKNSLPVVLILFFIFSAGIIFSSSNFAKACGNCSKYSFTSASGGACFQTNCAWMGPGYWALTYGEAGLKGMNNFDPGQKIWASLAISFSTNTNGAAGTRGSISWNLADSNRNPISGEIVSVSCEFPYDIFGCSRVGSINAPTMPGTYYAQYNFEGYGSTKGTAYEKFTVNVVKRDLSVSVVSGDGKGQGNVDSIDGQIHVTTGNTVLKSFDLGMSVTLTATPTTALGFQPNTWQKLLGISPALAAGSSKLSKWEGCDTSVVNPDGTGTCSVTMNSAKNVTATFVSAGSPMYYCRTADRTCQQTSQSYLDAATCQTNLGTYLPGQTTGTCFAAQSDCSSACAPAACVPDSTCASHAITWGACSGACGGGTGTKIGTCSNGCGGGMGTTTISCVNNAPCACAPDTNCSSHPVTWLGDCNGSCGGGSGAETGVCNNGCSGSGTTARSCTNNTACPPTSSSSNWREVAP